MHVQVYVPERFIGSDIVKGVADPYDYRITLLNTIVDTSKAGFGWTHANEVHGVESDH